MKALIIIGILVTFGLIFVLYSRNKEIKRLLAALASFALILSLGIMGNVARPIIPLFLMHILLTLFAWGGLLYYLVRGRYVWWVIFSPVITIILFILLSLLEGSRYEDTWGQLF
ncbi:hypothetical protein ACM66Z_01255 [Sulfurovum sp. ST-21]|uniref:Uncharacterized protein n=1 Tax=Sulfurovum indicum TaxID=2779528 RepID=A0A7M1S4L8_9BACT|nr:hypothetical protein [Sulfurovum indicum]QOR62134.1 hypothetical protein IMZ28_01245 [Sulfurovum indicum]